MALPELTILGVFYWYEVFQANMTARNEFVRLSDGCASESLKAFGTHSCDMTGWTRFRIPKYKTAEVGTPGVYNFGVSSVVRGFSSQYDSTQ